MMKMVIGDFAVEVTLSRRNILTLLHKLDMPGSARTIVKEFPEQDYFLIVKAEDDDEHYQGRTPGFMHPDTEDFIEAAKR
jgi:hypothetical protein